jgi:hypothetical protein
LFTVRRDARPVDLFEPEDVLMNVDSRYSASKRQDQPRPEPSSDSGARRIFLNEPGWDAGLKIGSERSFCSIMLPGQDYYHRLLDGELFLYRGDERICLACAERRGMLSFEPKVLRSPPPTSEPAVNPDAFGSEFDLKYWPGDEEHE